MPAVVLELVYPAASCVSLRMLFIAIQEVMQTLDKSQHLALLHMLVWLLQHELVHELHTYLVLVIPPQDTSDAGNRMQ